MIEKKNIYIMWITVVIHIVFGCGNNKFHTPFILLFNIYIYIYKLITEFVIFIVFNNFILMFFNKKLK